MKICIVSESHDRCDALAGAVREAATQGAKAVIHCGDLVGTRIVRAAMRIGPPMPLIHSNDLGDSVSLVLDIVHSPLAASWRGAVK